MERKNVNKYDWNLCNPKKFYNKIDIKKNFLLSSFLLFILLLISIINKFFYDSVKISYLKIFLLNIILVPITIFLIFIFFNTFYKALGSKTKFLEALSGFSITLLIFFIIGAIIKLFLLVFNSIFLKNILLYYLLLFFVLLILIIMIFYIGISFRYIYKLDYYKIYSIILLFGLFVLIISIIFLLSSLIFNRIILSSF